MQAQNFSARPGRALIKLGAILLAALAALAGLAAAVEDSDLETLKHSLSLETIVALVVIINLISFIVIMVLYAAWQWVRGDLKAPRPEKQYEDDYPETE